MRRVRREHARQQAGDFLREMAHDLAQASGLLRVLRHAAAQGVLFGAVGDVFVHDRAALALAQKKIKVGPRKIVGEAVKNQNPARFQLFAAPARAFRRAVLAAPALLGVVIADPQTRRRGRSKAGVGDGNGASRHIKKANSLPARRLACAEDATSNPSRQKSNGIWCNFLEPIRGQTRPLVFDFCAGTVKKHPQKGNSW